MSASGPDRAYAPTRVGGPRHLGLAGLALLLVFGTAAGAEMTAGAEEAQALVADATTRVLAAVEAQRDAIRADPKRAWQVVDPIVSPLVDRERVGRLVLGKNWRRASQQQRERFIAEFGDLVMRTYATALAEYHGVRVEFLPPRPGRRPDEVTVRSRVPVEGASPLDVDYLMSHRGGHWMVFDVRVDGVSLVTTYRNSFASVVRRTGLDGLIEQLAAKNRGSSGDGA